MNRRVLIWLTVVFGIGALLDVSAFAFRATLEVLHHRGAETYVNAYGMQIHWSSVLTTGVAGTVALAVALVARIFVNWRKKKDLALIKKLDARNAVAEANQDK